MTIGYSSDISPDAASKMDPLFRKNFTTPDHLAALIYAGGKEYIEGLHAQKRFYAQALEVFNEVGTAFSMIGLKRKNEPVHIWRDDKGIAYNDKRHLTLVSPTVVPVVEAVLSRQLLIGTAGLEVCVHREAARQHEFREKRGEEAVQEYIRWIGNVLVYGKYVLTSAIGEPERKL